MSRFYGSIRGSGNKLSTRCGHATTGIESHTRGWNLGVKVIGTVDKEGNDVFEVYLTGGSNGSRKEQFLHGLKDSKSEILPPLRQKKSFKFLEFKDIYKIFFGKMMSIKDDNKDSLLLVRKVTS